MLVPLPERLVQALDPGKVEGSGQAPPKLYVCRLQWLSHEDLSAPWATNTYIWDRAIAGERGQLSLFSGSPGKGGRCMFPILCLCSLS